MIAPTLVVPQQMRGRARPGIRVLRSQVSRKVLTAYPGSTHCRHVSLGLRPGFLEKTRVGAEADLVRRLLADHAIDDGYVVTLDDRPTTLKERYIGRAQDRHPQQMMRVDYETRDPIPAAVEALLLDRLPAAVAASDIVLISD